jgi:spermidine/putrescine transport system substrate-binding protein
MTKLLRSLLVLIVAVSCASLAQAAKKKKGELNLFGWSEYIPQAVIDGFTEETGVKVNYETYASGEEMLAKLVAGGARYDLIQPPDYIAEALIKNGQLLAIDAAKLTNFGNLLPEYLNMPHDPEQKYSVPYMVGTVGIAVNTEKVSEPIKGYADVFNGKHKGRIVMLDDGRELATAALYIVGRGLNDYSEESFAAIKPILAGWFSQVRLFDSDSPKTALLNGDVDLGMVWCGEAALLYQENKKFAYVIPTEGAHIFVDLLAIPQRAKNPENAVLFIDYILRPEISKLISDDFPYTNPNGAARKLLSEEQLNNPASYPKLTRKLDTFRYLGEDVAAKIDALITDLKNSQ